MCVCVGLARNASVSDSDPITENRCGGSPTPDRSFIIQRSNIQFFHSCLQSLLESTLLLGLSSLRQQ